MYVFIHIMVVISSVCVCLSVCLSVCVCLFLFVCGTNHMTHWYESHDGSCDSYLLKQIFFPFLRLQMIDFEITVDFIQYLPCRG